MVSDDQPADRTSAQASAELHEQGRLACCPPQGSCPVDEWARAYLAGHRRPYPLEDALRNFRDTQYGSGT